MIDLFALAVSHGLMMLAVWRLLSREDLNREEAEAAPAASAPPPARKRL
jgi:hypothetical protein